MLFAILTISLLAAVSDLPAINVRRPTIVAFFPPATPEELKADPNINEALADFRAYAKRVREPLQKKGIDFHEVYARSFRIRIGAKVTTFHVGETDAGYYLVVPGKKPRIEYGVMSAADLLDIAEAYFGMGTKAGLAADYLENATPRGTVLSHD